MGNTVRRHLRTYAISFLIWTVFGLFFFTQSLWQKVASHEPTPWLHYLASWLVGCYLWALLTPTIFWLSRKFPLEKRTWFRRIPLHLVFSIAFTAIQLTVESAILLRLKVFPAFMVNYSATLGFLMVIGLHQALITYWEILGVQHAIAYYRRYQEREKEALRLQLDASELKNQLVRAQLSALKMQLQPHFLFNTLNAIMVLVRQQKGRQAEQMLSLLSDLLRSVLEDVEVQEVPLRRELESVQLYLSIEQVRFQDRLRVEISADPSVLDAAVPHMCLQPIVENAIRHGIGRSSAAGRLEISAVRIDQTLQIQVRDDGPGLSPPSSTPSHGIGLANTRARLQQLYATRGGLTVSNGENGGVVATMTIPYHDAPERRTELMEVHAFDHADR